MKILVTGGTGFVGAHTIAALRADGHDVRMLVRNRARVANALGPLGVTVDDVVLGDVTDAGSVGEALEGCQAVIHAAAMVTFDRAKADEVARVNVDGTRNVLGLAVDRGLDPVIHVSSVSALDPRNRAVLTVDAPVAGGDEVYAGTKGGGERVARSLQETGAPVTITYPGGVWGPHDPSLGENTRALVWLARMPMIPSTSGGYLIIDVRDLAAVHVAALRSGCGPRRYSVGGRFLRAADLAAAFTAATGRRALVAPTPAWSLRALGRAGDLINTRLSMPLPFTSEGMDTLVRSIPTDDSVTLAELGVTYRDTAETVGDALRWLHDTGHLTASQVGQR